MPIIIARLYSYREGLKRRESDLRRDLCQKYPVLDSKDRP